MSQAKGLPELQSLLKATAPYRTPLLHRSIGQLANTVLPYCAVWVLMALASQKHYALTWLLLPLGSGLLVRAFILQHDCGHGSFFASRWANELVGNAMSMLTVTPFAAWRANHIVHHATSGNLDKRGIGYFELMTTSEYLAAPPLKRWLYRVYRHPVMLFLLGPFLQFGLLYRLPSRNQSGKEQLSVLLTNVLMLGRYVGLAAVFGWQTVAMVELPILVVTAILGVWLFYLQHHFHGAYWESPERWDFVRAAIQGSSFYKLPKVLQWFSGNIGFHHVHHFDSKIPNYNLEACHNAVAAFREVPPLTLGESLKSVPLHLWDETKGELVSIDAYEHIERCVDDAG